MRCRDSWAHRSVLGEPGKPGMLAHRTVSSRKGTGIAHPSWEVGSRHSF